MNSVTLNNIPVTRATSETVPLSPNFPITPTSELRVSTDLTCISLLQVRCPVADAKGGPAITIGSETVYFRPECRPDDGVVHTGERGRQLRSHLTWIAHITDKVGSLIGWLSVFNSISDVWLMDCDPLSCSLFTLFFLDLKSVDLYRGNVPYRWWAEVYLGVRFYFPGLAHFFSKYKDHRKNKVYVNEVCKKVKKKNCTWVCYTAGHTKRSIKKDQRYHSELYLPDNMLFKDQTIEITASCDVWMMTISVVSVASIVGYNRCHTPRHTIKNALDVSLAYSSSCGFHILPKLIWCSSSWCNPGQSLCKSGPHVFDWR
ncbi:uncharacterized protein TNCV_971811 [Trichonephila clavipes]|nr:uncharacterized protein TNCV_971811 [Trichonephila clavipes]